MKNATLQIRIDADLKEDAERLFTLLGTSTSEATRIFLKQSVELQQFPFPLRNSHGNGSGQSFGMLNLYVNPQLREAERDAWIHSLADRK